MKFTRKLPIVTSAPTYTKIATAPSTRCRYCQTLRLRESAPASSAIGCSGEITGSLSRENTAAIANSVPASTRYGVWVVCSPAVATDRIRMAPIQGPTVVPAELKACVRFRRLAAVRGSPRMAT
jgi:hypothetical protein